MKQRHKASQSGRQAWHSFRSQPLARGLGAGRGTDQVSSDTSRSLSGRGKLVNCSYDLHDSSRLASSSTPNSRSPPTNNHQPATPSGGRRVDSHKQSFCNATSTSG